jgi:nitronate monooxygenase
MDNLRQIRQGGMGVYIGTPFLAKSVALHGGYGTVSGALADQVLVRALQLGDIGGHFRRALNAFPNQRISNMVLEECYLPYGKTGNIKIAPKMKFNPKDTSIALVVCANFALVWLAKEGHDNPIAINYLEKVQMPIVYALVGAMLAGVDCVTMGAGIPKQVPGLLDAIARGDNNLHYNVDVIDCEHKTIAQYFDTEKFFGEKLPPLKRPDFIPIVSSHILAQSLLKSGGIQGFVVETDVAGGHNAPPRGNLKLNEKGEPIYSEKDKPNLVEFKKLGLPFWVGGGYASKEALAEALSEGAAGVQLGSIFALCSESGMRNEVRTQVIGQLYYDEGEVYTDPKASPTGFPFKTVDVDDSVAKLRLIRNRKSLCDLGALVKPCLTKNGLMYRCSAEPLSAFTAKGGSDHNADGAICLCNGLLNNSILGLENDPAVVTLSSDTEFLIDIINRRGGKFSYSVLDIMYYMGAK